MGWGMPSQKGLTESLSHPEENVLDGGIRKT